MNKSEKWEKLLLEINQTYKDKYIELDLSIFNGGEKCLR